ncbi:hypothetical protein E2C01_057463 [Portunus trituberculatus]|uniref:Uncharacterized protein n=1 Tax=Portunus trituberculatus TaxID=210409 RepID=A0A5B7H148_PORTR|nr:hypothetical protein [Portunus trituberculatus]
MFMHLGGAACNKQQRGTDPHLAQNAQAPKHSTALPRPSGGSLALHRQKSIKEQGLQLLQGDITLHDLASFIGLAMAANPAVELNPPQLQVS